jgi:hypothetical protein
VYSPTKQRKQHKITGHGGSVRTQIAVSDSGKFSKMAGEVQQMFFSRIIMLRKSAGRVRNQPLARASSFFYAKTN